MALFGYLVYLFRVKGTCGDWTGGLADHSIENDGGSCKIPQPSICELGVRDGLLDFTRFVKSCPDKSMVFMKDQLPINLRNKKELKRIGFPRVENLPGKILTNEDEYRKYVNDLMVDMDDPEVSEDIKANIEYVIDISNSTESTLEINLKRNNTLAEIQKQKRQDIIAKEKEEGTYDNRIDKNVLILYIDNFSRAHFFRKMPLTAEWLEQFVDNEESEYTTYQFFKYHSVYYNTQYTNAAMYYGEVKNVNDTSQNVFDSFTNNGYVTGYFTDS